MEFASTDKITTVAIGSIGIEAQDYAKSSEKRDEKWGRQCSHPWKHQEESHVLGLSLLGVEVYLPRVIEYYASYAFDA